MPRLQLKVTPKQIAANHILQRSSLEPQDLINQELEENPALEQQELAVCPLCGNPLAGPVCTTCFGGPSAGAAHYDDDSEPLEDLNLMLRDDADDDRDPIVRAEAEQTLAEYLLSNLRAILPRRRYAIAEYLVGNLDDDGYLRMSVGRRHHEGHRRGARRGRGDVARDPVHRAGRDRRARHPRVPAAADRHARGAGPGAPERPSDHRGPTTSPSIASARSRRRCASRGRTCRTLSIS